MHPRSLAFLFAAATTLPAVAQDSVTLHSVAIDAANNVHVVYSKNFATCAHMHGSNASCFSDTGLVHTQNFFCTQGTQVSITLTTANFLPGFGVGSTVYLAHGNNGGITSPCVQVVALGSYGQGCAGVLGAPSLSASDDAPQAGTTLGLTIGNGLPSSIAVLGFGQGQTSFPLFGCNLLLGSLLTTATVPFDSQGTGTLSLPLPASAAGFVFTAQAFAIDPTGPQGFSATNGRQIGVR